MNKNQVEKLLLQYRDIVAKLYELDVIRSGRIVSDYGEYIVCRKLRLKQPLSSVNKGFDAVDNKGLKYEIKSRWATPWNKPTLFAISKNQLKISDYVIYIEFDNNWNIVKLLKIPSNQVIPNTYNRVHITKSLVEKYSILK